MRLADKIAQCRTPFVVQHQTTRSQTRLNGAADFAKTVALCPTRYVLADDLTRICTALAYSKGARTLRCADLLRVPSPLVWVEWCEAAWQRERQIYGIAPDSSGTVAAGRRGVLIESVPHGRCGLIRTFWSTGDSELNVFASSMEAYFDLDIAADEEPEFPDGQDRPAISVFDSANGDADLLRRYFRFRYERTWAGYYDAEELPPAQRDAIAMHSLGTIAIDIPVVMAFFLLLATRVGLPQRPQMLQKLNLLRVKARKPPLLDYVEVLSPILSSEARGAVGGAGGVRRKPRLHHVRGHLMRRGNQLFWRVPHVRGDARLGSIRARTVTWTFDRAAERNLRGGARDEARGKI